MNEFYEHVRLMHESLRESEGPFALFGLLAPADDPSRWNLTVSASWLPDREYSSYEIIFKAMKKFLTKRELRLVALIVILPSRDKAISVLSDQMSRDGAVPSVATLRVGEKLIAAARLYELRGKKVLHPPLMQSAHGKTMEPANKAKEARSRRHSMPTMHSAHGKSLTTLKPRKPATPAVQGKRRHA